MTDPAIQAAVAAALKDPQVGQAIADSVQKTVQEKFEAAIPDVVKGAVLGTQEAAERKAHDPYRTTLHFLAGLVAFCLAVIVGIVNALPDPPVATYPMSHRLLGGVLAWIALTALIATVCAIGAQYRKHCYRALQKNDPPPKVPTGWPLALMLLPVFPGAMAVVYCVGCGLAMLNNNLGPLKSVATIAQLWPF